MNAADNEIRWDNGDGTEVPHPVLPFSKRFNDHYFSKQDGSAETRHVFLAGNGLPDRWCGSDHFVISELGFGTGLNFLETWYAWQATRKAEQELLFQSVEAWPIRAKEAARALSAWPHLQPLFEALRDELFDGDGQMIAHQVPLRLDDQTRLLCVIGQAESALEPFAAANAWYLDGFSPDRNADMWSQQLMQKVACKTVAAGTVASYTAAGWVRRNLQSAGFTIEKRPGFGRKRDMISGIKT
ncbi:MAG: tRNA (5-methylaminomethyl-2-thiouridine)(34)-methyltransferase MnmD [Ahrensia sp.]|nr:tRNA (5-methylaminomethyl-2-thiouridine)(34)-methyltransferase MnmD [Ahrensia sp.]